jgi:hypothetical protein
MPASGTARGLGEQRVDFLGRGLAPQFEHAVGQRGIEHRRAHRVAVQLALQIGVDQRDGRGAAGGCRRQAQHRAAGAPQVLVGRIHHEVGIGRVMDGGDLAMANADGLVHDLHHGRQAVRGARGGRDDPVAGRFVKLVVDADHDVQHVPDLHRRRHDHPFRATVQVAMQGLGGQEFAGALQYEVHAQLPPGDIGAGRMRRKSQPSIADSDRLFALGGDVLAPFALHAVEGQQVRGGRGSSLDLVEMDHLQAIARARIVGGPFRGAEGCPQGEAADTAHAIDPDFHDDSGDRVRMTILQLSNCRGAFVTIR